MNVEVPRKYVLGEFELEPDKYLLKRNGERVHLPELPFQVLLYLIENRQRYVSRQELLDRFWAGSEAYEETLTKCISTIRTHLDARLASPRFIETRKKVGYRYIGPIEEQGTETLATRFEVERTRGVRILVEEEHDRERALPAKERALLTATTVPIKDLESQQPTPLLPATLNIRPASSAKLVGRIKQHALAAALTLAALVLVVAGVVYFYFARAAAPIDSIAVLPLVNTSNDPNTEYLSDGIAESIISNLSQLPQLKVMAHSTVFGFKGQQITPQEVGRKLGVRAVMVGRLLRQGDQLVIRTELVNVSDGTQLWGAEYNRKLSDVLAVQQDISREISENLRLRLTSEEKRRLTGRDTTKPEAYQSYLRGRHFFSRRTEEGIKKAIEEFQHAVDLDPNYALGYIGLADCYLVESLPKAREAADRALKIDDTLAEAHTSSAMIYYNLWRWQEAEEEFKRAINLNPNYPQAHQWFSVYLRTKRRFDEAMIEIKRAQELDPLSAPVQHNLAQITLLTGDVNSAIDGSKRMLELDPNWAWAHNILGWAYLKQRRDEEAIAEFQKAFESLGLSGVLSDLGYCYAVVGRRDDALKVLKELDRQYTERKAKGLALADVYAALGDKDQAFAWLEKDFEQHSNSLIEITWSYGLESLRSEPRYVDLVRRMGL